jgi:hypothetical protein
LRSGFPKAGTGFPEQFSFKKRPAATVDLHGGFLRQQDFIIEEPIIIVIISGNFFIDFSKGGFP